MISNTSATLAGIAKTIEHARGNQLHLLEVLKIQELAIPGKDRDKIMKQAGQTYESNTDKVPSQYHLHVVAKALQELDSRTIGRLINKRCFPAL